MKKLTLVLTLALVLAFAMPVFANPFSDVPADHWAYDAIAKLAADGVITGNPDGTYTGKKNLTRYEIAVIVAKAMASAEANADQVSAENQATIDKLAAEYSNELAALGVKVAALEKKIGNVKFTGDVRARYLHGEFTPDGGNKLKATDGQLRVRLTATAAVNDKVSIVTRLTTNNYSFKEDNGNKGLEADRVYVQYADKGVTATVGRQDIFLGKGTIIDDAIKGIVVAAPVGKYTVTVAHGRLDNVLVIPDKQDLTAIQFDGVKLLNDKLTLGFDYSVLKAKDTYINDTSKEIKLGGINLDYAINDKLGFFAEFTKTDAKGATNTQKTATYLGLTAKDLLAKKTKTELSYAKFGAASVVPSVTTLTDQIGPVFGDDKTEVWRLTSSYEVMPSTTLYVDLSKAEAKDTDGSKDKYNFIEAGVKFEF